MEIGRETFIEPYKDSVNLIQTISLTSAFFVFTLLFASFSIGGLVSPLIFYFMVFPFVSAFTSLIASFIGKTPYWRGYMVKNSSDEKLLYHITDMSFFLSIALFLGWMILVVGNLMNIVSGF